MTAIGLGWEARKRDLTREFSAERANTHWGGNVILAWWRWFHHYHHHLMTIVTNNSIFLIKNHSTNINLGKLPPASNIWCRKPTLIKTAIINWSSSTDFISYHCKSWPNHGYHHNQDHHVHDVNVSPGIPEASIEWGQNSRLVANGTSILNLWDSPLFQVTS